MSAGIPGPAERKVIMAECQLGGVFGGLTVSVVGVGRVVELGVRRLDGVTRVGPLKIRAVNKKAG